MFDADDVEAAFRFMAQGKHIGKVLIKVKYLRLQGNPAVFYYAEAGIKNNKAHKIQRHSTN